MREIDTLSLDDITKLKDQIWDIVDNWADQPKEVRENYNRQTLLKGLVSLLHHKDKRAKLRICRVAIHIFDVLYNEKIRLTQQ